MSSLRSSLKPSKRLEFEEAFASIDENSDGRLQKVEIKAVLDFLGMDKNIIDSQVESFFEHASPIAKESGLDLDEFLDLMARADIGTAQSAAQLVVANSNKITSQYKNHFSSQLAERNAIKHKKADVDEDSLSRFLSREDLVCLKCYKKFESADNHDTACEFHPVSGKTHTGVENYHDRVTFDCCGRVQIGTNPVLSAAMGCQRGRHEPRPMEPAADPVPNVEGLTLMGAPGAKSAP